MASMRNLARFVVCIHMHFSMSNGSKIVWRLHTNDDTNFCLTTFASFDVTRMETGQNRRRFSFRRIDFDHPKRQNLSFSLEKMLRFFLSSFRKLMVIRRVFFQFIKGRRHPYKCRGERKRAFELGRTRDHLNDSHYSVCKDKFFKDFCVCILDNLLIALALSCKSYPRKKAAMYYVLSPSVCFGLL